MRRRIEENTGILLSGTLMTGSGMTSHPGPLSGDILLPTSLVFYAGSYSGGALSVRWNGDALLVEETGGGNFDCSPHAITPGPDGWVAFWEEIDEIGVWLWDDVYVNPHGCCGVTYWQLVLDNGERSISCSGEDRFPGGVSSGLTPDFRALVTAIQRLCGNYPKPL